MAETFEPQRRAREPSLGARPPHRVVPVDGSWWSTRDLDSTTGSEGGGQSVGHGDVAPVTGKAPPRWIDRLLEARSVAGAQGVYYALLALWSLVAPHQFNMVVWQSDTWLARLAGGMVGVVAVGLLYASRPKARAEDSCVLGIAAAVMLTSLNLALLGEPNASRVHLVDLGAELTWVLWWMTAMLGLPTEEERRRSHFHQAPMPPVVDEPDYH